MARPIWNGTLSFGLLHVPVSLMPGERRSDLSFRMLDSRDNSPIRYERVNAETGDEVPWAQIVKAFEYDKGNYVVLEEDDLREAAAEGRESVDVEGFVAVGDITPQYFEKPYVLVPGRKAEKGYVLLREALAQTGRIGIARVVIRTRQYLAAVMPQGTAILLILLRFPQELVPMDEYRLPEGELSDYRIVGREMDMARELIESMTTPWRPEDHRDEFRERLVAVIDKRLKASGVEQLAEETIPTRSDAATNVVDFVSLLEQSIKDKRRTPAGSSGSGKAAKKTARKTAAASKSAGKATSKSARKSSAKGTAQTKAKTRTKSKAAAKKTASRSKTAAKGAARKKA